MNNAKTPKEALQQAIEKAGGIGSLAKTLGLSGHAVIHQWRLKRVPAEYCPRLEQLTGVPCEALRPDMDWYVVRNPATQPAGQGV